MQISNEECAELLRANGIAATDRVDIKANRAAIQQMSFCVVCLRKHGW